MTGAPRGALYSREMLALAVELAAYPFDPAAAFTGDARSRTCGSTVSLSASTGELDGIGLRVSACAVGQAAAAIFAGAAQGKAKSEIAAAEDAIRRWLEGDGAQPDWPRIALLAPALPHRGRHEAILLPWRAALAALSKAEARG